MSMEIYHSALWIAVVWPLLLAIPALHTRLPWPRHLAILPAAVLTLLPGGASLDLPRLLFGSGLAIEGDSRWILAMSVGVWLTAATLTRSARRDPPYQRTTTLFLLTLTGNLGAVLTTDLVGFITFSTLMGYSFYGLLLQQDSAEARHAARLYLLFLIIADLALFEALILASSGTEDLHFAAVRQAMAETPLSQFYLAMTLTAFGLKAGVWPLHLWLSSAFRSASRPATLLLGGVPVAMGLLGALRWLPLGEQTFYTSGMVILVIGVAAILYAATRLFLHLPVILLPAWATIGVTGLFSTALGTALAFPLLWHQYQHLAYPFIALMGILLTALTFASGRLQETHRHPHITMRRAEALFLWTGKWRDQLQRGSSETWLRTRSLWRISLRQVTSRYQQLLERHKSISTLPAWGSRITILVLLGLALAWLAR